MRLILFCFKEMLRLHRQIDADKEFECYLRTKGQRRVMLDLEAKRKKKHEEMRKMLESQLAAYDKMLTEISVIAKLCNDCIINVFFLHCLRLR